MSWFSTPDLAKLAEAALADRPLTQDERVRISIVIANIAALQQRLAKESGTAAIEDGHRRFIANAYSVCPELDKVTQRLDRMAEAARYLEAQARLFP